MDFLQWIPIIELFLRRSLFWETVGLSLGAAGRLSVSRFSIDISQMFSYNRWLCKKLEPSEVISILREISSVRSTLYFFLICVRNFRNCLVILGYGNGEFWSWFGDNFRARDMISNFSIWKCTFFGTFFLYQYNFEIKNPAGSPWYLYISLKVMENFWD